MPLPNWLTSIFSGGGKGLIEQLGDAVGEFVTTDKERTELQMKLTEIANAHLQAMEAQATEQYRTEVADRDGARQMATAVAQAGHKNYTLNGLAWLLAGAFLALVGLLAFKEVPSANARLLDLLIGFLGGAFMSVVSFFFGSSMGGRRNAEALRDLANSK